MGFKLKRVILVLILLAGSYLSYSQDKADSLRQILAGTIPDTTRINALIQLSDYYSEVNSDSALLLARQAREIVEEKGPVRYLPRALRYMAIALVVKGDYSTSADYLHQAIAECNADSSKFLKTEKAFAYNLMGVLLVYQGSYDSALFYYFKSLAIFQGLKDKSGIMYRYNNIANIYQDKGNYPLALRYYFKALESAPNTKSTSRVIQNIGLTYSLMNEAPKAKEYLLKSLTLYGLDDAPDNTGVAYVNQALGKLYSSAGNGDSAVYYLTSALRINKRARHNNGMAQDHYYFALHYKNNGNLLPAFEQVNRSIDIHHKEGEKLGEANSTLLLSEIEFKLGRIEEAKTHALRGMELSEQLNAKHVQQGYLDLLTKIYSSKRDYTRALAYSQQLNILKDSINNEEKIKQVANMEALYENDKKEKELALVRAQKLTADAQLGEQKSKTTLLIAGLGLVSLLLITGMFFYISLKKNRKALQTKNEELSHLNRTKDRFFAIVGHDLRGPITAFSGINDLLNWYISKNDMEQVKAFGGKITQSVRQLDTLLNNLLNWAMSQTDAVPYRPEPLQLNQLTKECSGYFQHSLELKNIVLSDNTGDDLFVYADKNALATVLRNLVSNAIKFTPSGGTIKISTKPLDNVVWVHVSDTGVGVPEDKAKTIFDLADNKTTSGTSGEKGTGLGLVLCSDYVKLNKGVIKVESREGGGSVFSFSVPAFQSKELLQLKSELING